MKRVLAMVLALTLVISCFTVIPVSAADMFKDVNGHWAKDTILELAGKGIINGKGNGIYDPEGTVTRAEFMKLLVCALGEDDAKATFGEGTLTDVKTGDWYYSFVASGLKGGVVDVATLDKGKFLPDAGMTRGNVAIWMTNGLGISSTESCKFSDVKTEAEKEAVATASIEGLVTGYEDNTYRPGNTLTRAEAAVIVKRVMNKKAELTTLRKSENKADFNENVTVVSGSADKNVLKTLDEKARKATFVNCTDELKNLQVGQVLYLQPSASNPDGVLLKVGGIKVDGDTVVIDCVKPELYEVFNKIDISQKIPVTEENYIEGTAGNGVTLMKSDDRALVADNNADNLLAFVVQEHGSKNIGEFNQPLNLPGDGTGLIKVKADVIADIFMDIKLLKLKDSEFKATLKVESSADAEFTYEKSGEFEKSWDLGDFSVPIYGPISANVEINLVFTAEGEYEVTAKAYCKAEAGLKCDGTKLTRLNDVSYGASLQANASGELRIGPEVVVGLGVDVVCFDPINVADVEANVGVGIEAETAIEHKLDGNNGSIEYTANNTVPDKDGNIHICDLCVDGSIFVFLNGNAGISRDVTDLFSWKELRADFGETTWTITDWYASLVSKSADSKIQFGLGTCPNLYKQIKFSKNPEDVNVTLGEAIKLVAEASAGEKTAQAIVYKWYKDGKEVEGQTDATLSIPQAKAEDAGTYKAVAYYSALSESVLSAKSKEAKVVVSVYEDGPKFLTQPQDVEVEAGFGATLNATTELPKGAVVEYQWYKDGKAINGAKTASYSILAASDSDAGVYYCEAWISGFENLKSTSEKATLKIKADKENKDDNGVIDTDIFGGNNTQNDSGAGTKPNSGNGGVLETDIFN